MKVNRAVLKMEGMISRDQRFSEISERWKVDKPKQTLQSRANIRTVEGELMLPGNGAQTGSKLVVGLGHEEEEGISKIR